MKNLDDINGIHKLDPVNVLGSIELLGKQCGQSWNEVADQSFPASYANAQNIVFSGMGGSSLGAYVIKSLFRDTFPVPFEIINDYHLPAYVNHKTLVLLGTYSGSTEETISSALDAMSKKAMITGFTAGSTLAEFFRKHKLPYFHIDPKFNPSNQPRLGTGYTMFSQVAILNKLGYISVSPAHVEDMMMVLEKGNTKYGVEAPTVANEAKLLAKELVDSIPVIITSEFLTHVGRVMRNQINECAKSFAAYHEIPELNHHLMEGFTNPTINRDVLRIVFYNSNLYSPKIKKRLEVTKQVLLRQNIPFYEFIPQSTTHLSQVFECIQFGAYTNFYMSMLYGIDPSKIPWVDYFKAQLAS